MKAVVDRIVQYANRYQLTNVETGAVLGTFDFDEVTGTVTEAGTEINKALFDSIADDLAARVKLSGGELAGTVVTFSDISDTAANVASGDTSATLWGKVKNWFSRLKALAFKNKVAAGDFEAGAIKNADVAADAAIAQNKVSGLMTDYVASISVSGSTVTYKNKNGANMGNVSITKANVGLGNVDNTSDANKPVSTAQAAAIKAVETKADDHIKDKANPHNVTRSQVDATRINIGGTRKDVVEFDSDPQGQIYRVGQGGMFVGKNILDASEWVNSQGKFVSYENGVLIIKNEENPAWQPYVSRYVPCKPNTKYTFSVGNIETQNLVFGQIVNIYKTGVTGHIFGFTNTEYEEGERSKSFTTKDGQTSFNMLVYTGGKMNAEATTRTITNLQIEEGTTATAWEEYKGVYLNTSTQDLSDTEKQTARNNINASRVSVNGVYKDSVAFTGDPQEQLDNKPNGVSVQYSIAGGAGWYRLFEVSRSKSPYVVNLGGGFHANPAPDAIYALSYALGNKGEPKLVQLLGETNKYYTTGFWDKVRIVYDADSATNEGYFEVYKKTATAETIRFTVIPDGPINSTDFVVYKSETAGSIPEGYTAKEYPLKDGIMMDGTPVLHTGEMTLTEAEKQQARDNIDAYSKPSTGIPETDLAQDVKDKLNKSVDVSGKADKTYVDAELAKKQNKGDYALKSDVPSIKVNSAANADTAGAANTATNYNTSSGNIKSTFDSINARLASLGFKQGSAALQTGTSTGGNSYRYTFNTGQSPLIFTNTINFEIRKNSLKRQGNYVFWDLEIYVNDIEVSTNSGVIGRTGNVDWLRFAIPSSFLPKATEVRDLGFSGVVEIFSSSSGTSDETVDRNAMTCTTDGSVTFETATIKSGRFAAFTGWEAKPL